MQKSCSFSQIYMLKISILLPLFLVLAIKNYLNGKRNKSPACEKGPGLVYVSTVEIVDKRFLYERNCASDVYICLTENDIF